ncbi:MAG: DUF2807 domain-containing protein [Crocinitomicaceae bacterium]
MRLGIIFIIALLTFGCKKSEDRNCIKSIGDNASKEILVDDFEFLYMGPHLKYKLIQDVVNKVVVTGGGNLINGIDVHVENQKLVIENSNECAFLRSYEEVVEVEIHFVDMINIEFEGTHEVICPDTLLLTDFTLLIRDGAGAFDLKLNANSLNLLISHGWGNYVVGGFVNYANFQISSNGYGNSNGLHVLNELVVISNSAGLVEVNADQCNLLAEINSSGSIYYKGTPAMIQFNNYGTGELVDKN